MTNYVCMYGLKFFFAFRNGMLFHSYDCCDCMGSYLGNGITNIGIQMLNCLWFAGIRLFFNGIPQKTVKQVSNPSFLAANWHHRFDYFNGSQTFDAIIRLWHKLYDKLHHSFSFSKKQGPMMPPLYNTHQTVTRNRYIGFWKTMCGFSEPEIWQFCLFTYSPKRKWVSFVLVSRWPI